MTVSPLPHRHHWEVRSAHLTSLGWVRYQQCVCGEWQVSVVREADLTELAIPVCRVTPRADTRDERTVGRWSRPVGSMAEGEQGP